ncbi:MAG: transposase [Actinomycetota bacterium]|nr:transposase [Actinomycetota bacterium]
MGRIVQRVVVDHLDERRLDGLVAIGVDEISYRRHHRYLTRVVDHQTGGIVWCSAGRNAATLQRFFDELGERKSSIRAVSIDMSGGYEKAIRASVPDAEICFDPFHVVRLAQRAVDQVRRDESNAHERSHTPKGRWIKGTRWSLLKPPAKQSVDQLALLHEVQQANQALYRGCLLKRGTARALSAPRPYLRARASRRVAHLGFALPARPVHQARPHHPPPPRRHPRRDPPRADQRPPRRPQQSHPPDQPPKLQLPLRRPPNRPRLPLLRPHHHKLPR